MKTQVQTASATSAFRFEAFQVCPDSPQLESDFLCMFASLEKRSNHPGAVEIVEVARINNILPVAVTGYQVFPGRGVGGIITLPKEHEPRPMLVGSVSFLTECGMQIPELLQSTIHKWETESNTVVVVGGWDGSVRGALKFIKT